MSVIRVTPIVVAIALSLGLSTSRRAEAMCSPSALSAVRGELRAAEVPRCGPKSFRRTLQRARKRASSAIGRAMVQCASARAPRIAPAHKAFVKAITEMEEEVAAGKVTTDCASPYHAELERMDAELAAAASGTETTTTTSAPGTPTTTTRAPCLTITLEVDKSDCSGVTSDPAGLVECGANCDVMTFTVPASSPLRLKGRPAPGDSSVSFGGDCDDDGTVLLGDASSPDCTLSCDCSSGF